MYFQLMHSRLVENLRERIRRGEISERALARQAGVSQPHLHNVLKGLRILSSEMADQAVERLHIPLRELLPEDEPGFEGGWNALHFTTVPLLDGSIGPDQPFPSLDRDCGSIPFLRADVAWAIGPVAVRLAADPEMRDLFGEGDLALLARLPTRNGLLQPEGYFAIDAGGSGRIRRLDHPGDEDGCIWSADRNILEVVRARVIWIGRYLERSPIAARPVEEAGGEHRPPGRKG
jgi:transcriptional regulator with XRE-family HTH domain